MSLRERIKDDYGLASKVLKDAPWLCVLGTGAVLETSLFQIFHIDASTLVQFSSDEEAKPLRLRTVVNYTCRKSWITDDCRQDIITILDATNECRHQGARPTLDTAAELLDKALNILSTLEKLTLIVKCPKCGQNVRIDVTVMLNNDIQLGGCAVCSSCKERLCFQDFKAWKEHVHSERQYRARRQEEFLAEHIARHTRPVVQTKEPEPPKPAGTVAYFANLFSVQDERFLKFCNEIGVDVYRLEDNIYPDNLDQIRDEAAKIRETPNEKLSQSLARIDREKKSVEEKEKADLSGE